MTLEMDVIECLKQAINNVPSYYYCLQNPETRFDKGKCYYVNYHKTFFNPERTYMYNLYHQLMKILENMTTASFQNFFIDSEIGKKINCPPEEELSLRLFGKVKSFATIEPDLILHKNQNYNGKDGQLLILECKTDPKLDESDFNYDLYKLNLYCQKLKFQNAVFLITNVSPIDVCLMLERYFKLEGLIDISRSRILLIVKESAQSDIEVIDVKKMYCKYKKNND